jgi:hypothetical protein
MGSQVRHTNGKEVNEHRAWTTTRDGIRPCLFGQAYVQLVSRTDRVSVCDLHDRPSSKPDFGYSQKYMYEVRGTLPANVLEKGIRGFQETMQKGISLAVLNLAERG